MLPLTNHFHAQTACLTCLVPITPGTLMSGNVLHLMFLQEGHCICVAGSPGKSQNCFGLVCVRCCSAGRCKLTGGLEVLHNSPGMPKAVPNWWQSSCPHTDATPATWWIIKVGRMHAWLLTVDQHLKCACLHCCLPVTASESANVGCRTLSDARAWYSCLCPITTSCECT